MFVSQGLSKKITLNTLVKEWKSVNLTKDGDVIYYDIITRNFYIFGHSKKGDI